MKPLHDSHASAKGSFDNIFMNGQEVFKFAVRAVPSVRCCSPSLQSPLSWVKCDCPHGRRSLVTHACESFVR